MQITMVPGGHITNVLSDILPHLHKLAPRTNGRSSVDDILQGILSGESSLWLAFEETEQNHVYGVTIARVVSYPRCKMLNIYYCAGHQLRRWQAPMMEVLIRYSKDCGCSKIELTGRPGWEKALKPWNVVEAYRTYEIEVTDG